MECEALKRVRDEMGLTNVEIMVPFVRTLSQAERVVGMLAEHGLKRGENGLQADHDVRGAVATRSSPRSSSSTSTASRSARTT